MYYNRCNTDDDAQGTNYNVCIAKCKRRRLIVICPDGAMPFEPSHIRSIPATDWYMMVTATQNDDHRHPHKPGIPTCRYPLKIGMCICAVLTAN